jgi:hypothetical protein
MYNVNAKPETKHFTVIELTQKELLELQRVTQGYAFDYNHLACFLLFTTFSNAHNGEELKSKKR